MDQIKEGTLLWEPGEQFKETANLTSYLNWLKQTKNLNFNDYHALWNWSVEEVPAFWESIWDYFEITASGTYNQVLSAEDISSAKWFSGTALNYTEHIFKNIHFADTAIIHASETRETTTITWQKLYEDTAKVQAALKKLDVKKGDRVVAYLPNIYEATVAFLATASLGAIWSSASPDFGTNSVIDRFSQIEPKVMLTVDGYTYGGKRFDRSKTIRKIQKELPTLSATIVIPYLNKNVEKENYKNAETWNEIISSKRVPEMTYERVPFNDPLWILFSSGTTGKPKPIVHSQGGILLEHYKANTFHMDLKQTDRFFWFTTTGWMMWNFLVGALLTKSTIILYDGSPTYPEKDFLWRFVADTEMTVFGTSASYLTSCMKEDIRPKEKYDLSKLKCIGSTGSPLPPEGFLWCYEQVKKDLWIASLSGGTDVCTAFILGVPTLPVYAGELQCRGLGAGIVSFSSENEAQIGAIGELVITEPMPCMPIYFWNDPGRSRLHESYFADIPGVWRHGDYLKVTKRNSCVIYGRSDATINRGGVRIGTSEIYRAVDLVEAVVDSLIVDVPKSKGQAFVPLFVVMKTGSELTETIKKKIIHTIKTECSPRHAPTHIYAVDALPITLNGKKLEVPIKRILMGANPDDVVNIGAIANPEALEYFVGFAK